MGVFWPKSVGFKVLTVEPFPVLGWVDQKRPEKQLVFARDVPTFGTLPPLMTGSFRQVRILIIAGEAKVLRRGVYVR